jgi:hypothetical protein
MRNVDGQRPPLQRKPALLGISEFGICLGFGVLGIGISDSWMECAFINQTRPLVLSAYDKTDFDLSLSKLLGCPGG